MRELKFRAWNKKIEKMSEEFSFEDFDRSYFIPEGWNMSDMDIMQYVWRKDKNGKELWEGDIVQVPFSDSPFTNKLLVKWNNYHNCFCLWWDNPRGGTTHLDIFLADNGFVIGNKYENPELLK